MIIFCSVDLNALSRKGRSYPWTHPGRCPGCQSFRLWGHGFALAFFDGFMEALLIRRYRCPDCGGVFRCRPLGYFSRFQASVETIRASVVRKAGMGKWTWGISRSRQNHWYRGLLRHISAYFGNTWLKGPLEGFDALLSRGLVPVTRCI
jgi:hypothetical protein